ncbi:methyl-accepting chemotaxis protein [Cytobacillus oceanisediminis]|uniref:methyl-accepting chemotaxis protein n=1 Tax=Cytobacillus oceanisediminis TaxID=665099 RepID=UPI001FB5001F|nr:methyl-accepting chemotaxis protein [Cytobacillus oceanisediminis]
MGRSMMFGKGKLKQLEEEKRELESKIQAAEEEFQRREKYYQTLIHSFNEDLTNTVSQHEMVNGQHYMLGDLVLKIKDGFENVKRHSEATFTNSLTLSDKGGNLIQSAKEMVKISEEGRGSVSKSEQLIKQLGEQLEVNSQKMEALSKRSKEIEMIVQVIKDIADQTNLLALNASIEAARAGEQGKGFAVVADEVRKLAESTATSTANISSLTKNIQDDIEATLNSTVASTELIKDGMSLSGQTTSKIDSITNIIHTVESEVSEVIEMINIQKGYSQEVADEISETKYVFDQVKELIQRHIDDARVVDEKLEGAISQVKAVNY